MRKSEDNMGRGRKTEFPVKELMAMDEELSRRIEAWRRKQDPIPNRREAVRQLLDIALTFQGIY